MNVYLNINIANNCQKSQKLCNEIKKFRKSNSEFVTRQASPSVSSYQSTMEEVLLRFSHLGQDFFSVLDNEDLVKCRNVSRSWKFFIDNAKFSSKRIIQTFFTKPRGAFKEELEKATLKDMKKMARIIQKFCQLWKSPMSELHQAAIFGDTKVFRKIFDDSLNWRLHGVNLSPLALAAGKGYLRIIKLIKENEKKIITTDFAYPAGTTPFHIAIEIDSYEIASLILKNGWNIQPRDENGTTPLHLAAKFGNAPLSRLLLRYTNICEDPWKSRLEDNVGRVPLHIAAENGHSLVCKQFEKYADHEDQNGITPLHLAAKSGHVSIYESLVKCATGKNPQDHFGRTPLHYAAEYSHFKNSHFKIFNLLLEHIKDKNPREKDGMTPFQLAVQNFFSLL